MLALPPRDFDCEKLALVSRWPAQRKTAPNKEGSDEDP
jgi:hypothetical protein